MYINYFLCFIDNKDEVSSSKKGELTFDKIDIKITGWNNIDIIDYHYELFEQIDNLDMYLNTVFRKDG